ncbi:MAG: nucleoside triphosphate pyrophosphohydrolase [Acidimicrobiia bacterium]
MGRLIVVGLGPAGTGYLLPAAREALESATVRFVRTRRHPAVAELEAVGITFTSFDDVYDAAPDLESAYTRMVDALVEATSRQGVVYAVPGNPAVAERTVVLLRERGVDLDVVPGLSFADLAWARLGVDPMAREARVVDARVIDDVELSGPVLIGQCDHVLVLSDVKLALLEHLDPETPITVLQRLGLAEERVERVPLVELDRVIEPDHLTSLFVDVDTSAVGAAHEVARLLQLTKRLRDPEGCPWDAEQTHQSLTRYLLEESYEVVEVVDALPDPAAYTALADELGDLLYQVVFHAVIAEETDEFTMVDVARGIHDKLVRRHPHVFGDVVADESADVVRNWEQIKKAELGSTSIVEGIPPGLPSLLYTHKLFSKAASVGLDPGALDEALDRVDTAVARLRADDSTVERDLAQILAAAVVVARAGGIDAESALRGWAARYRGRFEAMERLAVDRNLDLAALDEAGVAALWLEAAAPA